MAKQRFWQAAIICVTGLTWANGGPARAQETAPKVDKAQAAANVPLHLIPEQFREGIKSTIEKPAMFSQGPVETFACDPTMYYWLLEHPDRGVGAWRKLGAQVLMISDRGAGKFGWTDEHGSDLHWEAVYHSNDRRIWYAEGKVRPAALMPMVPVKAVVVLRYNELNGPNGAKAIQHQADMFVYTDSLGATIAAKLLGAAAPKMAEQCISQMQTYFGGLAWYCHRYPDRVSTLFTEGGR